MPAVAERSLLLPHSRSVLENNEGTEYTILQVRCRVPTRLKNPRSRAYSLFQYVAMD
jgi:hypothetical protein